VRSRGKNESHASALGPVFSPMSATRFRNYKHLKTLQVHVIVKQDRHWTKTVLL